MNEDTEEYNANLRLLDLIPVDVRVMVYEFLSFRDLKRLGECSKTLHDEIEVNIPKIVMATRLRWLSELNTGLRALETCYLDMCTDHTDGEIVRTKTLKSDISQLAKLHRSGFKQHFMKRHNKYLYAIFTATFLPLIISYLWMSYNNIHSINVQGEICDERTIIVPGIIPYPLSLSRFDAWAKYTKNPVEAEYYRHQLFDGCPGNRPAPHMISLLFGSLSTLKMLFVAFFLSFLFMNILRPSIRAMSSTKTDRRKADNVITKLAKTLNKYSDVDQKFIHGMLTYHSLFKCRNKYKKVFNFPVKKKDNETPLADINNNDEDNLEQRLAENRRSFAQALMVMPLIAPKISI